MRTLKHPTSEKYFSRATLPFLAALLLFAVFSFGLSHAWATEPVATFCNPLNLDYQPFGKSGRTGADPVILPFKGKYYLFDSQYHGGIVGYRVSTDLIHWQRIPFGPAEVPLIVRTTGEAFAPGITTDGEWIYMGTLDNHNILRTRTPDDGSSWETYSTTGESGFDPMYLFEDHRLFRIYGFLQSFISELDPKNFHDLPGTKHPLTPLYDSNAKIAASPYGLYQGRREYESRTVDWNLPAALDTSRLIPTDPPVRGQFNTSGAEAIQEAGWLTRYHGKYYLQNSGPGTACPWYSDTVYTSDNINGPYALTDYATASMKVGGFINSTGHSGLFQDFHGNWWRVTTMWIGVCEGFERRLGLFPAGFDAEGRMFTQTGFGDYPLIMPAGPRTAGSGLAGWSVLSKGKACTASSSLSGHGPALAADENVRTWWSAASGGADEWFQVDLGQPEQINAVQVNFAEQDWQAADAADDYHAYRLLASTNGQAWITLADKSANRTSVAHDYVPLDQPLTARYLKVVNVHMARGGKFALRDLRVFGHGGGQSPASVADFTATRDARDCRNVTFRWKPVEHCDGYMIHYGVAPDALHLSLQYQNPTAGRLTVSCLNRAANYFCRIDAYNDNGVTEGKMIPIGQ